MTTFPTTCPVCNSTNIEIKTDHRKVPVPMAESTFQKIHFCHCKDCLSDILLDSDAPKAVQSRMLEKAKESLPQLIKKINETGYTDARVERVFSLAAHTLNRWKQGRQVSAAAIAFTRCLALLPELVQAAETGFDEERSRLLIMQTTIEKYKSKDPALDSFYFCNNSLKIMGLYSFSNIHQNTVSDLCGTPDTTQLVEA